MSHERPRRGRSPLGPAAPLRAIGQREGWVLRLLGRDLIADAVLLTIEYALFRLGDVAAILARRGRREGLRVINCRRRHAARTGAGIARRRVIQVAFISGVV